MARDIAEMKSKELSSLKDQDSLVELFARALGIDVYKPVQISRQRRDDGVSVVLR